jgi:GT2 family glycosyltransferase
MLNVDTIILPGALEAMCAYMDAHPEAGAVGCRLLNADGTTQRSAWLGYPGLRSAAIEGFYLWRLFPSLVTRSEVSLANPTTPQVVDHLLGACIVVPRRVIDQVGALDPVYPLYFEETDWCLRIQRGGWQVVYLPDSSIVHLGQQTQYLYPGPTLPMYYTRCCHYMRKYGGRWPKSQLLLLKTIIAVSIILRLGLWSLRMVRQQTLSRRMLGGYSRVLRQLPSM